MTGWSAHRPAACDGGKYRSITSFLTIPISRPIHLKPSVQCRSGQTSRPALNTTWLRTAIANLTVVDEMAVRFFCASIGSFEGACWVSLEFDRIQGQNLSVYPFRKSRYHIFSALAQFARRLIQERTKAGLDAARARGRKGGRKALAPDDPPTISPNDSADSAKPTEKEASANQPVMAVAFKLSGLPVWQVDQEGNPHFDASISFSVFPRSKPKSCLSTALFNLVRLMQH